MAKRIKMSSIDSSFFAFVLLSIYAKMHIKTAQSMHGFLMHNECMNAVADKLQSMQTTSFYVRLFWNNVQRKCRSWKIQLNNESVQKRQKIVENKNFN